MALRWNAEQVAIYDLIQTGVKNQDVIGQGHKLDMVKKVRLAISRGDAPQKPPEKEKNPPAAGEPLYSTTLKTHKVTLDPIVAVRYDAVRHALGWGDDYTLENFIDEATDIATELVGAVPPGFTKEEEQEPVTVGSPESGGD